MKESANPDSLLIANQALKRAHVKALCSTLTNNVALEQISCYGMVFLSFPTLPATISVSTTRSQERSSPPGKPGDSSELVCWDPSVSRSRAGRLPASCLGVLWGWVGMYLATNNPCLVWS